VKIKNFNGPLLKFKTDNPVHTHQLARYADFFVIVTDPDTLGSEGNFLTDQDP